MPTTLASLAKPAAVPFDTLDKSYRPVMGLVKQLIGVIPNCDPILEIWPVGFRTYNVLVPNMFNLPATLFGSKSLKSIMGLAMYASSRAAECPYCSAHTCSFALRRGATTEAIVGNRSAREAAAIAVAEALSCVPHRFSKAHHEEFARHFSLADRGQIVRSVCMMGFLNKFMDAVGVELEQESIADVGKLLAGTGWKPGHHVGDDYRTPETSAAVPRDNLLKYLKVIRHAPGAVRLDRAWTRHVPGDAAEAKSYLEKEVGYGFPMVAHLKAKRAIRAVTTVLKDNLDKNNTPIGLKAKCLAASIYATIVQSSQLEEEARTLSARLAPTGDAEFDAAKQVALSPTPADAAAWEHAMNLLRNAGLSPDEAAVLVLARAAAPSPAEVTDPIVKEVAARLRPEQIVETVVWLSVLQLLNRLYIYYSVVQE